MSRSRRSDVIAMVIAVASGAIVYGQAASPRPFPGSATPPTSTAPKAVDGSKTTSSVPGQSSQAGSAPGSSSQAPGAPTVTSPTRPVAGNSAQTAPPLPPGVVLYPNAEFLTSFDAGNGQRYYLYGTNTPFADIVNFYKTALKNGGRELYKIPPMQQFDLGKFQEETMVYPPSIVVKDYTWNNSAGYLHVAGTQERRFKTVIQVVPPGPAK